MTDIIFYKKIRELRKDMELSQEELADKIGVSRQTIFSLESGKSSPSLELALKIAQVFNSDIEELFFNLVDNSVVGVDSDNQSQLIPSGENMNRDLMPFSPFHGLGGLHREIDRFFDESFSSSRDFTTVPALNIHESEKNYTIELAVPGYKEDEIDIEVQEDFITVKGVKQVQDEENKKGYLRREFAHGSFERSVSFPSRIDKDIVEANLTEGMLEIMVPKIAPAKPKVKVLKPVKK